MKHIILLFTIATSAVYGDDDRVFANLQRKVEFETSGRAEGWKFEEVGFREWLTAVSDPSWELLLSTQTSDLYFAVFRSGDHLIFWNLDRKGQYNSGSTGTTPRWIGPSKIINLTHQVRDPLVGFTHNEIGSAFQIPDDFDGLLKIEHSAGAGEQSLQVFSASIRWKHKAEQAGTGQPATRSESKSEGGDKPQPEAEGRSK